MDDDDDGVGDDAAPAIVVVVVVVEAMWMRMLLSTKDVDKYFMFCMFA